MTDSSSHEAIIAIQGMDCSECARVIEHSVERLDGVLRAQVDYAGQRVTVAYDSQRTSRYRIEHRLQSLGYGIVVTGLRASLRRNQELLFNLAGVLMAVLAWLGGRLWGFSESLTIGLYLAAYGLAGWEIGLHALKTVRRRQFDTDLLMVLAAIGAAILGDFAEGALLIILFSLGHALEERALDQAHRAVAALADLAPRTAAVRRGGNGEVELPVDEIAIGEQVIIRPGGRIPIDGMIVVGQSAVNQAPVTGEPLPVDKAPGDKVYAGSINGDSLIEVQTERLARDSTLARVMHMVEEAQSQKSKLQQTLARVERIYVPGVLAATLLMMIVPPIFGLGWRVAFLRAMTLLVAASPCALALGTPAAVLAGIAQAARHGVLIKGGAHLEALGSIQAVAFDKTGTLTLGQPRLQAMTVFNSNGRIWHEDEVLALAGALESQSAHPLAAAVTQAADERALTLPTLTAVQSLAGRGLQTAYEGQTLRLGSPRWLLAEGIESPAAASSWIEGAGAKGQTLLALALGNEWIGLMAFADPPRSQAATMIANLRHCGVRETILLTGDNAAAAQTLAQQVGIHQVIANLLPEDKNVQMQQLVARHGVAAMVGDGVNDAAALASASVGIAMGGARTQVALEAADVVLMGDDLSQLPYAIELGRATRAIIRQNLWVALTVIVALSVSSVLGLAGIGVAVVLHEGSTLVVAANALRLLRFSGA